MRYLHDYDNRAEPFAPRFLLNDLMRYWRTVAVDYQAKRWDELEGKKWGSRYLKLRTTRKLAHVSNLVGALIPYLHGEPATVDRLAEQFATPSLARIAQLHEVLTGQTLDALRRVLLVANEVVGWLDQPERRTEMDSVTDPAEADPGTWYYDACQASAELHDALGAMFHGTDALATGASASCMADVSLAYLTL